MSQAHSIPSERLFLSAVEIWAAPPNPEILLLASDKTNLSVSSGLTSSGSASSVGQFLAERLWKLPEATVILPQSEPTGASEAILSIPWYADQRRSLSLLLKSSSVGGTFEVWHVNPNRNELRLSSGYFCKWEDFRRVTASTRFVKGSGLPGRVWATHQPVLLEDLSESKEFLRADAAQSIGLEFGIGLPVKYASGIGVVVLLSSLSRPVARSIDIWRLCSQEGVEHLQGLSLARTANEHTKALSEAKKLAFAAATRFLPQVLSPSPAETPSGSDRFLDLGFAWPSRDRTGAVHVATLIG